MSISIGVICFLVGVLIAFVAFGLWRLFRAFLRFCTRVFIVAAIALALASFARAEEQPAPPGKLYRTLGWATFAGSAGDALSTEYALRGLGAYELNPLLENRGVRIGSAVAFPLVSNYLTEELREDGHPTMALWCRVAVVALKGFIIYHNLRQ